MISPARTFVDAFNTVSAPAASKKEIFKSFASSKVLETSEP
jgi:hypothetical protein